MSVRTGLPVGWTGQAWSFAERYLREMHRNRSVLFWAAGFPAGFYLLSITVFIDTGQVPDDVLPVVKASIALSYGTFGALVVCLNVFGQQLVTDVEAERYRQFRALPVAPSADVVGRMVAGFLAVVASLAVVLGVSVATGGEFTLRSPAAVPVALAALVALAVPWMAVALVIGSFVGDSRHANIVTVSVAMVAYFLTGYNGTDPSAFGADPALLNLLPNTLPTRVLLYQLVETGSGMTPPPAPGDPVHHGLLVAYAGAGLAIAVLLARRSVYGGGRT